MLLRTCRCLRWTLQKTWTRSSMISIQQFLQRLVGCGVYWIPRDSSGTRPLIRGTRLRSGGLGDIKRVAIDGNRERRDILGNAEDFRRSLHLKHFCLLCRAQVNSSELP